MSGHLGCVGGYSGMPAGYWPRSVVSRAMPRLWECGSEAGTTEGYRVPGFRAFGMDQALLPLGVVEGGHDGGAEGWGEGDGGG